MYDVETEIIGLDKSTCDNQSIHVRLGTQKNRIYDKVLFLMVISIKLHLVLILQVLTDTILFLFILFIQYFQRVALLASIASLPSGPL